MIAAMTSVQDLLRLAGGQPQGIRGHQPAGSARAICPALLELCCSAHPRFEDCKGSVYRLAMAGTCSPRRKQPVLLFWQPCCPLGSCQPRLPLAPTLACSSQPAKAPPWSSSDATAATYLRSRCSLLPSSLSLCASDHTHGSWRLPQAGAQHRDHPVHQLLCHGLPSHCASHGRCSSACCCHRHSRGVAGGPQRLRHACLDSGELRGGHLLATAHETSVTNRVAMAQASKAQPSQSLPHSVIPQQESDTIAASREAVWTTRPQMQLMTNEHCNWQRNQGK
jgi:hypothetical protein